MTRILQGFIKGLEEGGLYEKVVRKGLKHLSFSKKACESGFLDTQ